MASPPSLHPLPPHPPLHTPMRSRRNPGSKIPEVNLVPMMDVLMTVLTFFIIISMTLTGRQLIGIDIPDEVEGTDAQEEVEETTEALIVGLDSDGEILFEDQKITFRQLTDRIRTYFAENPEGKLVLKADSELPYSDVANFLTDLRDIGGSRVSLAVE
ncbi:MAG: ExbD/TolR family protein [Leptolyngbyaceae cyanobacterium]